MSQSDLAAKILSLDERSSVNETDGDKKVTVITAKNVKCINGASFNVRFSVRSATIEDAPTIQTRKSNELNSGYLMSYGDEKVMGEFTRHVVHYIGYDS